MVDMPENPTQPNHIYLIHMEKQDMALNKEQWLIFHKTQCCDTMGCMRQADDLCLFWCETQAKGLSSKSPARPEVDKKRKVQEKRDVS